MAAAGAIVSNISLSHWLIALMNDGKYQAGAFGEGPPGDACTGDRSSQHERSNARLVGGAQLAYWNGPLYCLLPWTADNVSWRRPPVSTQVSFMPNEHIGVIVFVIGNHTASLYNPISYNVYERLLGMEPTPWTERLLDIRLKSKKEGTEARSKAGFGRVAGTKPSHPLAEYVGEYEHPAYGILKIGLKGDQLQFDFHKIRMPLTHFHYDRFDTADDEEDGKWSVNFSTNPRATSMG